MASNSKTADNEERPDGGKEGGNSLLCMLHMVLLSCVGSSLSPL